jgi:hypothetical protein
MLGDQPYPLLSALPISPLEPPPKDTQDESTAARPLLPLLDLHAALGAPAPTPAQVAPKAAADTVEVATKLPAHVQKLLEQLRSNHPTQNMQLLQHLVNNGVLTATAAASPPPAAATDPLAELAHLANLQVLPYTTFKQVYPTVVVFAPQL